MNGHRYLPLSSHGGAFTNYLIESIVSKAKEISDVSLQQLLNNFSKHTTLLPENGNYWKGALGKTDMAKAQKDFLRHAANLF